MLVEFSVANFLSFKNRVTFSMVASNDTELQESNVVQTEKHRLVKSAVVYGANASGKSNLLSAIRFMRRMVLTSSKDTQANEEIDVTRFLLSTDCDEKPSTFEMVFLHNQTQYRYGFEVDQKRIHSEWLFSVPTTKEAEYFVREGTKITVNPARFKEGKGLEERTRENALFLSVCAQFNGEVSKTLLAWFQNLRFVHGVAPLRLMDVTVDRLKEPKQKQRILDITRVADPGIVDFSLREEKIIVTLDELPKAMPEEMKKDLVKDGVTRIELKTTHRKLDGEGKDAGAELFDLEKHESSGTQRLVKLAGPLLDTLETGKVLVVDELDARLHPLLTRLIVNLFNSAANRSNAQLIFATHDAGLLTNTIFRRDQIWFTEKGPTGASSLYSLVELKGVRKEASFGKDYILGKYGAIPFIGDPASFLCEGNHD